MWSADASNYRRVPIGVVRPRDVEDVEAALSVCRAHDVPVLPLGARTSIAGQAVEHRRRPGLHARQPDPGDRPGRAHRPRPAGRGLRRPARRRRAARADVRPRPVHAQPLHARRDDRQQRLRVALGGVGQDRRQRRRPRRAHLPRRAAVARARGRRHPRRTRSRTPCARWASGPPTTSAPASPTSPAASPATTWTSCCPSTGRPRQGAGRHRGHVRGAHRGDGPAGRVAARPRAGRARLPGRLHRGRPRDGRPRAGPADHRGHGRRPDRGAARDAIRWRPRRASCPRAGAGSTSRPAARRAPRRDAAADAVAAAMKPLRALGAGGERTGADEGAVADPGGRRRDPDPLAGRRRGVAGLGGRRGAARAVRRLPAGVRRRARPPRPPRRLLRALRRRLPARADRLRPRIPAPGSRTSARSWRTRPTSSSRTAGRCPASTATARPAPSCCRGCTRRRSSGPSRSSRAIWDPDGRLNPDRVVRPARLDDDLRVFVGLPTLRDAPALAFAHDRGSFARATRRCLGVGKCVTAHGGVMCPSFRATGEEKHSTRGRARLLFEMATARWSRTAGGPTRSPRRWTCACRARAASATARSGSTWPPTRPSSSRSATAGGCARRRTTRWARCRAGCTWWAGSRRGWWTR